ncbi:MAG: adenylate/guanylate cyclase domain-containing protein [Alsobacter sp.]|jgi:adenylate cyclase
MPASPSADEGARLAELARYRILDTPPEFAHDALTEMAAAICNCPVALISIVDDHRQWFKSKYGLPADFVECPRELTVCHATVCANDMIYVPDLLESRFKDIGVVTGPPNLRFYCGMPLINRNGFALGTMCVVDFVPRELTPAQREAVRRLAQQTMAQLEMRRQIIERDETVQELTAARLAAEQSERRLDGLLRSMLPASIADELKADGTVAPRFFDDATVMLADFKGFTRLTETHDPAQLLGQLSAHFGRFDEIAGENRVEPLKTIGDAYLCIAGVPEPSRTHAIDACLAAVQIQAFVQRGNAQRVKLRLPAWELRIGINTGPIIAGMVGKKRLSYDVWGNSVNVAQRLEAACPPGGVTISASTMHHVGAHFVTEERGAVEVKNMGAIDMFRLLRIRPEFSADANGTVANDAFWRQVA